MTLGEFALNGVRVLITGSSGFVGAHLLDFLLSEDVEVFGIGRVRPRSTVDSVCGRFPFFLGDMNSADFVTEVLEQIRPTHIFHLAGVLDGAKGGYTMQYEVNLINTVRLLESVLAAKLDPWIMVASSSAVYGYTTPEENPLGEDRPLRPLSHYAVSKVAQEMAALQYYLAHKLRTVRVRTFNLVGPGQPSVLLASDLARQVALAERDGTPVTLRVGNVFPRRDYTDVRDAVHAYASLAMSAQAGEVYNVCSGCSYSVQQCVDLLTGMANVPLTVEIDEARVREVEIADQVGAPDRIRKATGWQPRVPLELSLRDLLDYWRARVGEGRGA